MKESKKAILKSLSKTAKKNDRFDMLVLNMALQKIDFENFDFDGDAVYTVDHKYLIYCLSQKESISIPEGTEVIGEMAFRHKKALKNIVIPSTVKTIGQDAFYDCDNLDNLYIPASVSTVRGYCFAECGSLKTVTFGGVPKHLSRHTFDDSEDLHRIVVPKGSLKFFQKALHYDPADDEYLIIEKQ